MILEEAEKLYNGLTKELTDRIIATTAAIRSSSLPLPTVSNNSQKLTYENDNRYQTQGSRYHNQQEIYNND